MTPIEKVRALTRIADGYHHLAGEDTFHSIEHTFHTREECPVPDCVAATEALAALAEVEGQHKRALADVERNCRKNHHVHDDHDVELEVQHGVEVEARVKAERERDDLRARLARAEKVVEAALRWFDVGLRLPAELRQACSDYRAALDKEPR